MQTQSTISIICGDGAMAIAFTVFVMLTVLLAVFIILLFVCKPFRKFLFRKDYELPTETEPSVATDAKSQTADDTEVTEPAEKPKQKRRSRSAEKRSAQSLEFNVSVPTVPLELVAETEIPIQNEITGAAQKTARRAEKIDDVRTVEIPDTRPYKNKREADRARFITTTPRTVIPRTGETARTAPPRKSKTESKTKGE